MVRKIYRHTAATVLLWQGNGWHSGGELEPEYGVVLHTWAPDQQLIRTVPASFFMLRESFC